jgi:Autophagy-related protein 101
MDLQSLIDSKTAAFLRYVDSIPPSDPNDGQYTGDAQIRATMSIQFFEKVTRRASWWASKAAESEVCWEKWDINCEFLPLSRNERGTSTLS